MDVPSREITVGMAVLLTVCHDGRRGVGRHWSDAPDKCSSAAGVVSCVSGTSTAGRRTGLWRLRVTGTPAQRTAATCLLAGGSGAPEACASRAARPAAGLAPTDRSLLL